jgi:hypothetical protein
VTWIARLRGYVQLVNIVNKYIGLAWQESNGLLAVVNQVVVYLVREVVLEVEPFPDQLGRRQADSRLHKQVGGGGAAAACMPQSTHARCTCQTSSVHS